MNISVADFANAKILVVGDVMLDQYWFGSVDRVSPEAPVPVLSVKNTEMRAGGAANVAHNLQSLGANSCLLSIVGEDQAGQDIQSILTDYGASIVAIEDASVSTIVKLRMMAQNHQLLRADFDQSPSGEALDKLFEAYESCLNDYDVVVMSDYGKGALRDAQSMIALAKKHDIPVIVDPKGEDYTKYNGASLITPNTKEFEAVMGSVDDENVFSQKAFEMRERYQLDALLVTRSEKGMSYFSDSGTQVNSPAQALEVYDVSGAGDTVIAMMALSKAMNFDVNASLHLANTVAGIVVGKIGTAVATQQELIEKLEPYQ